MGFFGGFPHVLQTNPQSALPAGLRMQDVGHMQGKAGTAVSVQMGTGRVLSGNMLCVICVYVYIYIYLCVCGYLFSWFTSCFLLCVLICIAQWAIFCHDKWSAHVQADRWALEQAQGDCGYGGATGQRREESDPKQKYTF